MDELDLDTLANTLANTLADTLSQQLRSVSAEPVTTRAPEGVGNEKRCA